MPQIKLGLLEFGTGQDVIEKLEDNLLEYAIEAEKLGYSRFWLGEHYLSKGVWYNPDVLITLLAGLTNEMSIGTAGLLMTYHNPYRVALSYKLLSNLFPGRIDLGIAKGMVPPEIAELLSPGINAHTLDAFKKIQTENMDAVISHLREHKLVHNTPAVPPYKGSEPNIWSLSTNANSLAEITLKKINYSRSLFHSEIKNGDLSREKDNLSAFRENYFAVNKSWPLINIAVAGLCCENAQKAEEKLRGVKDGIVTYNNLLGSPQYILDKCAFYQEIFGVEEIIFLNLATETKDKLEGITLLAKAFGL